MGGKSPMHPHHRPSVADGIPEPVPGLLSGGPNSGQQDGCAGYPSRLPAESFVDHDCSYASNEIAINWNAPLVYVANAMEVLLGPRSFLH
jgi:endoglucanase